MENKPDYLPEGISEALFVDIVKRVSIKSCYKFKFGCHEIADMQQKAYELAVTFLRGGKFKPRGEKPMERQLENFLRVWIYNRLSNFRRDKCCRYPNNGGSNQTKFNLNYPLPIFSLGLSNSEIFARETELPGKIAREEITNRIKSGLKPSERKLYDRYIEGETLEDKEFARLAKAIKRILPGNADEYI